jgi:hypothetical protein
MAAMPTRLRRNSTQPIPVTIPPFRPCAYSGMTTCHHGLGRHHVAIDHAQQFHRIDAQLRPGFVDVRIPGDAEGDPQAMKARRRCGYQGPQSRRDKLIPPGRGLRIFSRFDREHKLTGEVRQTPIGSIRRTASPFCTMVAGLCCLVSNTLQQLAQGHGEAMASVAKVPVQTFNPGFKSKL